MTSSKNNKLSHGLKKTALASFFIALGLSNSVFAEEWQMSGRYQVKDGLVKDPTTGLMWMRCSLGQNWDGQSCSGKAEEYTWQEAMTVPKHFEYAGYSDWRVPTIDELKSLIYCDIGDGNKCSDNAKRPTIRDEFPNTPSDFWSSSPHAYGSNYAWVVYFGYGNSNYGYKVSDYVHVRLVR
jgi:hypothetical protein